MKGLKYTDETAQSTWRSIVLTFLGDSICELGESSEAERRYRQAWEILEQADLLPSWRAINKLKAARARARSGDTDIDVEQLHRWRQANKFGLFDGLTARYIAEILLLATEPDVVEARKWLEHAIDADRNNGLALELAKDYLCKSELYACTGETKLMAENLVAARNQFQECGAEGSVEAIDQRISSEALATS